MKVIRRSGNSGRPGHDPSGGGFALIEVLVSLSVLAIGLMAVLTGVLASLDLQKDSERRFGAGLLLQEKLTEITVSPFGGASQQGISPDGVFSWEITSQPWNGLPASPEGAGSISLADSLADDLVAVRVDVAWETARGRRGISATQVIRARPATGDQP